MSAQQPHQNEPAPRSQKSFFQRVRELSTSIPQAEWEQLPKDLARNYKHYLYGHPKDA